ncbi:hypothetical protein D477_018951 [Arthrobacter crystallopoietes BAB-32]|uniref:Uncharacterized protein n=1 Tax=Arthrobacter crystallopoietes BAB-32 TaxID=1246476 RepID=N1UUF3_9MICC|nr:hypothetical protein D477_018951 [Arthrobacter crystallopoietes BAB-32]
MRHGLLERVVAQRDLLSVAVGLRLDVLGVAGAQRPDPSRRGQIEDGKGTVLAVIFPDGYDGDCGTCVDIDPLCAGPGLVFIEDARIQEGRCAGPQRSSNRSWKIGNRW